MDEQDGANRVATAAKQQAGAVGRTTAQAGGDVARTTKTEAREVVGEAAQQARDLVGEARQQVREQAGTQKARAVEGLRSLGDELQQMSGQGYGLGGEITRQVAERAHGLADQLDRHEPAELLDQLRRYARRRPAAFLTGAAVLGVLAGRLTRNLASGNGSDSYRTSTYGPGYGAGAPDYTAPTSGYTTPAADYTAPMPGYDTTPPGYAEPAVPTAPIDPAYPPADPYPAGGTGYDQGPGYDPTIAGTPPRGYEGAAEDPQWRRP